MFSIKVIITSFVYLVIIVLKTLSIETDQFYSKFNFLIDLLTIYMGIM